MTAIAGLWELQKAVLIVLQQSSLIQSLVGNPARVYDVPPTNPTLPLILMGDAQAEEWGSRDTAGMKVMLILHVYSNVNRGRADARKIGDALRVALHNNSSIAPAAGSVVLCQYLSTEDEGLDADGITWHGVTKFDILYQTT